MMITHVTVRLVFKETTVTKVSDAVASFPFLSEIANHQQEYKMQKHILALGPP